MGVRPIRSIPVESRAKMMDFGPGTPGRRRVHKGVEWFGINHALGTFMGPAAEGSADENASVNSTISTYSKAAAGASFTHRTMGTSRSTPPSQATCHLPTPDCPFHRTTGPPYRSTTRSKHYPRRLWRLPQSSGQTAQSSEALSPAVDRKSVV